MTAAVQDQAVKETTSGWSTERVESTLLVGILVPIVGASMAAAFTHMHDWTMSLMPGADEWFGWANAVISELLMFAGFLLLRRRIRRSEPYGGPLGVMIGGTALSLCAQIHSVGWDAEWDAMLLAALPALAFMVLIKLIMKEVDSAKKNAAAAAAVEAARKAETADRMKALTAAQAEIRQVRQALAEAETGAVREAETAAAQVTEAETAYREQAEKVAVLEAEISAATAAHQAEISAAAAGHEAEIAARVSALDAAQRELAGVRDSAAAHADAARQARADAEQSRRVAAQATTAATGLQTELAEARQATAAAFEQLRGYADTAGQAKDAAARAVADAATARRHATGVQAELEAVRGELGRAQSEIGEYAERARRLRAEAETARQATAQAEAHRGQIEAHARKFAELAEAENGRLKAEIGELRRAARTAVKAEIVTVDGETVSASRARRLTAVTAPLPLPAGVQLPVVEKVRPETVAAVVAAWHANPAATQGELETATGISDRTIRKVLKALNPDGGPLAIAAGQ
ncbi:hypothetical protein [Pilimelia columellifera]|uniref:DUF2637 domain-containing protein n=1 Tax=Pilimelia columellifera subsp. columellifera TaxID=706583 RepID=A0ABN3NSU5_9ACTN